MLLRAAAVKSQERFGTTGVRDTNLSFFSPALNGTLHFVQFEVCRTGRRPVSCASRPWLASAQLKRMA